MGFFDSIWSNFTSTIRTVGANINRYLPAVLGGIYKVSKFVENNGIVDAIKAPAGLVAGLAESAIKLHRHFQPNHPYYQAGGGGEAFVPTVDNAPTTEQPTTV